jgi:hypothetical protein
LVVGGDANPGIPMMVGGDANSGIPMMVGEDANHGKWDDHASRD